MPTSAEIEQRLAAVLEVIYLIFNEGYAATTGDARASPREDTELALVPLQDSGSGRNSPDIEFTQ